MKFGPRLERYVSTKSLLSILNLFGLIHTPLRIKYGQVYEFLLRTDETQ